MIQKVIVCEKCVATHVHSLAPPSTVLFGRPFGSCDFALYISIKKMNGTPIGINKIITIEKVTTV
eukprot:COSAG02_NODE_11936_length_1628_cov_15.297047_1_plen_65_part_00